MDAPSPAGAPVGPSAGADVVVGATDPGSMVAFLGAFAMEPVGDSVVGPADATALWGLARATTEVRVATPGAARPAVRVVHCDEPGVAPAGFGRGPRALDVYCRDMDAALEHLASCGLHHGEVGTLAVGPVTMRQCVVRGPDGMVVVLVESTHRRPSLLDGADDAGRLFSEGHSVVWCVDDMDAEAAAFAAAGFTKGMDLAFSEPEVSRYLALERSPVPIRMTMLSDAEVSPLRLELLEFPDDPADTPAPSSLRGGLWSLRWEVPDPLVAAEALCAANLSGQSAAAAGGSAAPVGGRAVRAGDAVVVRTPGGVRCELVPA